MKNTEKDRFSIGGATNNKNVTVTKIITDTSTGVQYLFAFEGFAGGLTLLVDTDGKPLIAKKDNNNEGES